MALRFQKVDLPLPSFSIGDKPGMPNTVNPKLTEEPVLQSPPTEVSHANSADSADSANGGKTWNVGTLSYSFRGLVILFCLLLAGDFAWSMRDRAVGPIAQLMLRQFNASDFMVGVLLGSLPTAFGLIISPIVAIKSDRYRSRWGRRIPFLVLSAPFAAISMIGLALTPVFGNSLHQLLGIHSPGAALLSLVVFVFFWAIYDVAGVVANAVFGGLLNDIVPEAVLGRFFGLFRAVSLLAGIFFNFWLMGNAENHSMAIFISTGTLYGFGFSWMCMKVKEGEYPPVQNIAPQMSRIAEIKTLFKTFFSECYRNPYYIWFFLAAALSGVSSVPVNSFSVFYSKSIGLSMSTYGKYVAITYAISLALSYVLGSLADRFHPLRASIPAIGLYAVAMLWGGFYATDSTSFGIAFILHGVLSGAYMTLAASLGQRLFPSRKFAQFSSGSGLFGSIFYLTLAPLVGIFLDHTNHIYRYTFLIGGGFAALGFFSLLVVHSRFMKYGGPKNYVAPE